MSDYNDSTIFDGKNGLTSGSFLRSVRQVVMAQGKHNDDQWIAQYAAARLDGQALQWYEEQDEETQESWKILRRRIIERWPPAQDAAAPGGVSVESFVHTPDTIPTPAAAPPPAAPAPVVPSARSPSISSSFRDNSSYSSPSSYFPSGQVATSPTRPPVIPISAAITLPTGWIRGKIEVLSMSGDSRGYIASDLNDLGYQLISKDPSEELIVTFKAEVPYHPLEIRDAGSTDPQYLAMAWVGESAFVKVTRQGSSWGCLLTATKSRFGKVTSSIISSDSGAKGVPPLLDVWHVLIDGSVVLAREEKPGIRRTLIPMLRDDDTMFFGPSASKFLVGEDEDEWEEVKLVLRPISY